MSKNLPATTDYRVVSYKAISGDQITLSLDTVRNFLVTGKKELVTEQELVFFMGVAKAKGMNPFAKDCYLVKFDQNPAAIIVAIDFCRARALAQETCRGWTKGVICLRKDGTLRYSHGLVLPDEQLVGGWFKAQPAGWDAPFELEVNLSGYAKNNAFWTKEKAPTMIAKCAESQGLRTLWPQALSGTLAAEEIGELSEALTAGEVGGALPPSSGSSDQSTTKEPEPIDMSAFDALVEPKLQGLPKEEYEARAQHLADYLELNAKSIAEANKKKKMTLHEAKVALLGMVVKSFEPYQTPSGVDKPGFWKMFLDWEAAPEREWNQQGEPEQPIVEPGAEGGPAEKAEADADAGDEDPFAPKEGAPETDEQRIDRVWNLVVGKYPKLSEMKKIFGITTKANLTADNIDAVEAKVKE